MKIKNLNGAAYNPRVISQEKLEMLGKAMAEFGDLSGIVYNVRTKRIVGGHQRIKHMDPSWEIEKKPLKDEVGTVATGHIDTPNGRWQYREVDWPEEREMAANIAANKHGGEFDLPKLKDLIMGIDDGNLDLDLLGFGSAELEDMFGVEVKQGKTEDDDAPGLPEKSQIKQGDLFELGKHRLLCGDITNQGHQRKLMDGRKGRLVFTDPPYNVAYKGTPGGVEWDPIENDDMDSKAFQIFLSKAFKGYYTHTTGNPALYTFHASRTQGEFMQALAKNLFFIKQQLIWNKGMMLGRADYHWAHEPIFYCRKELNSTWYGDRTHKTIQGYRKKDIEALKKEDLVKIVTNLTENTTDWEIAKDCAMFYTHPTQKPVRLAVKAILNNTEYNDAVLDWFGGSGSTLIACEKTDRDCYMMELQPKYCEVIIKRWEDFTGLNVQRGVR